MHRSAVAPSGVERRLGADELIVSKTDAKGVVTYANDVFCRMAALPEGEIVGQPHNLIRHPDMPRAVFKLLWDTIAAGREIFAYVNNLAADGANYWVFAHVTPTYAGGRIVGYHSNRRSPHSDAVAAVAPLYAGLVQVERGQARAADGLSASTALLTSTLAAAGVGYDEWVWTVTP